MLYTNLYQLVNATLSLAGYKYLQFDLTEPQHTTGNPITMTYRNSISVV